VSWFFKAGLSAGLVACALLLVPVGALARYPDDNGHHYGQISNPGHHYHYGWLRNGKQVPPANPPPTPNPGPQPQPGPHPLAPVEAPAGESLWNPDLRIGLPIAIGPGGQIKLGEGAADVALDWLILLVLPGLAAIWLLVFARAAREAARRRPRSSAQAA
jgi:4-amino-4-deoxy-L-arabinose transferase-like glycosyltransferase